jgi:hypothetical protein
MSEASNNPLEWLPQPGQAKEIPGGLLWCRQWKYTKTPYGRISGRIEFCFEVDERFYAEAMEKQRLTETKRLEAGQ